MASPMSGILFALQMSRSKIESAKVGGTAACLRAEFETGPAQCPRRLCSQEHDTDARLGRLNFRDSASSITALISLLRISVREVYWCASPMPPAECSQTHSYFSQQSVEVVRTHTPLPIVTNGTWRVHTCSGSQPQYVLYWRNHQACAGCD